MLLLNLKKLNKTIGSIHIPEKHYTISVQRNCVQSEEPHYGYVDVHLHYLEGHPDWVPVSLHDPANVFSVVFEGAKNGMSVRNAKVMR